MGKPEEIDEERRQKSEMARRAAMKERLDRQKERDRQIAADIANVDDRNVKKRIVFEDSDDEEEVVGDGQEETKTPKKSAKVTLFDSEDEDDGDGGELVIKNRHSGPKGEQLMKLESKFNSDPRFKLDDKFAETDSENDGNEEDDNENVEKMESRQEKEKNRELLSKILGKNVTEKKKDSNVVGCGAGGSDTVVARPFTRFDPENPEHVAWMKTFESSKQKKTSKSKKEEEEIENAADTEKKEENEEGEKEEEENDDEDDDNFEKAEIFYKLDDQFSNELKKIHQNGTSVTASSKGVIPGGGFSFLEMMGRKYEEKPESSSSSYDKEEDEEEVEMPPEKVSKVEAQELGAKLAPTRGKKFFVGSGDEQVRSMAQNFRRTQSLEKVIDRWTPHRDAIFKLWKKQRRDAMKQNKERFLFNGKNQRKRKNDDDDQNAESEEVKDLEFIT